MTSSSTPSNLGITVFCGSSPGSDPIYLETASSLATAIAESNTTLIYGGGTKGLMGQVARVAVEKGGKVHGIIPSAFMSYEAPDRKTHDSLETETQVGSMHERKKLMADLSKAFVGLPGGYGTLEEVMEMTTWSQLSIHSKPVVLLNVNNFYSPLRDFIEGAISAGFISPSNRNFLIFVDKPSSSSSSSPTTSSSTITTTSTTNEGGEDFDWGKATLKAIEDWFEQGTGGAKAFDLNWKEGEDKKKWT